MDRNKFLIYFAILLIGFLISYHAIGARFDVRAIGILAFFLIFLPTLINPDIGLIIIIVSMLFSPEIVAGQTTRREIVVRIEDVLLVVILLAGFLRIVFTKDIGKVFRTKLTGLFFCYIGICALSSTFAAFFGSPEEVDVEQSFFATLKYFEYFLFFLLVRDNLRNMKQVKIFMVIFLITAVTVAIATNTYIQERLAMGEQFFRAVPPAETRGGAESGTLGGYLVFMIAIAGGLLLYTRSVPLRLYLTGLILLMFRGFLYTLSRTSYIAFVPMVIAFILFTTKTRKIIIIYFVIAISLVTGFLVPQMVRDRILLTVTTKESMAGPYVLLEDSAQARIDSWKAILLERFPRSPIFGHGVGRHFVDSQVFYTLGETGLAGLLIFGWILFRLFKMTRETLNDELVRNDAFSMGITVGFLGAFAALVGHALGANTFIIIKIMEPFWFLAAIVLSLPRLLKLEKEKTEVSS